MDTRDRIISALSTEDASLRRAGVELVIEHVLAQPLAAYLDVEALCALLVQALHENNAARAIEQHVLPGLLRVQATLGSARTQVGDLVPQAAQGRLDALATNPRGPRFAWLNGALDRDKLRALLAPALQELFMGHFATRIPLGGRENGAGSAAAAAAGWWVGSDAGPESACSTSARASRMGSASISKRACAMPRVITVRELWRACTRARGTPGDTRGRRLAGGAAAQRVAARARHARLDDSRGPRPHSATRCHRARGTESGAQPRAGAVARVSWKPRCAQCSPSKANARCVLLEEAGLLGIVRSYFLDHGDTAVKGLVQSEAFPAWLGRVLEG